MPPEATRPKLRPCPRRTPTRCSRKAWPATGRATWTPPRSPRRSPEVGTADDHLGSVYEEMDVRSARCGELLAEHGIDTVIHLAADRHALHFHEVLGQRIADDRLLLVHQRARLWQ